jgi:hypothetical protein
MRATPPRSHFADADAARRSISIALPMIEAQMHEREVCGSGFLCLVIVDPALKPGDAPFEEAILLEYAVGDRDRWDADYAAFARAKAKASWEHGLSGRELQALKPHLLAEGDTLLEGAIVLDGIVVGASGAHPPWDEAFATAVAACLRAIAIERRQQAVAGKRLVVGA